MSRHTRREFLHRAAATAGIAATFTIAGTKASGRVLGANDTVRVAVAGIHGRGEATSRITAKMKGVQITYLIDPDSRLVRPRGEQVEEARRQHAQVRPGHPQGPGRQGPRRRLDRHLQPLAFADDHLGLPGGQGRLRGEAVQPQRLRGPQAASRPRGSTTASCSTARRAAPDRDGPSRWPRSAAASTASCWSPRATPASRAGASASSTEAAAQGIRLRPLARPGPEAALPRELRPLQLALVLGLRQRRDRQPGRPPDGHRPLGHPRRAPCPKSVVSLGGRFGYKDQGQTPNMQLSVFDFGPCKLIFEIRGLV